MSKEIKYPEIHSTAADHPLIVEVVTLIQQCRDNSVASSMTPKMEDSERAYACGYAAGLSDLLTNIAQIRNQKGKSGE
jgi:hypothetical protein